jgi:hypothetical protein
MSKYLRTQPSITSHTNENEDYWLKEFEKKLAVQPANQSVYEQITSIMNSKSKYPSVEAAVEDMKERSGFSAFVKDHFNKVSDTEDQSSTKTASDHNHDCDHNCSKKDTTPIVIKKCPAIKSTLENYIRDTRGNLPIPAIIDKIKSIHRSDVSDAKDWDDDRLLKMVSQLNLHAKSTNPGTYENYSNLGRQDAVRDDDIDPANRDAFYSLNPVKM